VYPKLPLTLQKLRMP